MSETTQSLGDSSGYRAAEVYDAWLLEDDAKRIPFAELLQRNPEIREPLEWLAHADADVLGLGMGSIRGRTIGDYRVLEELGHGGMGVVFVAEQLSLQRRVALKVLNAQLTLNPRSLERFHHEAEITGRLRHRGIIEIHQVGEADGVHFIAMELVEGASLDKLVHRMRHESPDVLRKRRLADVASLESGSGTPPERAPSSHARRKGTSSTSDRNYVESAVELICQVADALGHAHAAGVVHRDIKPSNILVRPNGNAVLTDFGLARQEGMPSVSNTGDFAGTSNYVSPEQAACGHAPIDHRSDIFSLGATLYELLTLELAFPGNHHEAISRILSKPPVAPHRLNPGLATDLVTIVLKALEKDPDQRYQTCEELADDLRAFIAYRPIRARRTPTVVRALRWVRREPLRAGLLAIVLVATISISALWDRMSSQAAEIEAKVAVPELVEQGYLAIATNDLELAQSSFGEAERRAPSDFDAWVGGALADLFAEGYRDVLDRIAGQAGDLDGFEPPVVARLLLRALEGLGDEQAAADVRASLAPPETALALYLEAALTLPPGDPTPSARRERAETAIALLRRSIQLDSSRAAPHFLIAYEAYVAGDEATAREAAESLETRWPDEGMAWLCAGMAREVFDPEAARTSYTRALELDPGLEAARRLRALLDEGGELERLMESEPESAERLNDFAARSYYQGRFEEAVEHASRAVELAPEFVEALDTLGTSLFALGRLEEAKLALEDATRLRPGAPHLWNDLGQTCHALGDPHAAEADFRKAIELDPGFPTAWFNLGNLLHDREDYEGATDAFDACLAAIEDLGGDEGVRRKLVVVDVPEHKVHAALGASLFHLAESGRGGASAFLRRAINAFEAAIELAPDVALYHFSLGTALARANFTEDAIASFEEALELDPELPSCHASLFYLVRDTGDAAECLAVARRWTDAHAADAQAWNELAWLLVDPDGDPDLHDAEAGREAAYQAAFLTRSQDANILDTYAWALHAAGRTEEGLDQARRGLERAETERLRQTLRRTIESLERSLEE